MPRPLRLKIAREYLKLLEECGERKAALLQITRAHYVTVRSVMNYVAELRGYAPAPKRRKIDPNGMLAMCRKRFQSARDRCENKNSRSYKYYGGKGIKFNLSVQEIIFMWGRDGADKMKKPSIDRIDSSKNYDLENCRFLEMSENARLAWVKRKRI